MAHELETTVASTPPKPFDEAALLADARETTGLTEFGDDAFRAPLRVLLASLADAPLNAIGTAIMRGQLQRGLVARLRAVEWFARHPEIADERIEAPLVVVGMMRSGTTLMQRVLARDPRHYCALGWEIGEPSPRPGTKWDEPDPRLPDAEARFRMMRDFAPELAAIHPSDTWEAEEEIVLLADAFLSHVPEASCHVPVYRAWLDEQDFTPAYEYLRRMLQFLQWQKKQRGEYRGRWVLKTPAHLGYLDTLFAVFPDAHVIHTHRSPLTTIPSGANLNDTLWRMHSDDPDPALVGRQWLERMAWATRRGLAARDAMPGAGGRFTDVWFRDAVADPIAQVERIYDAIGLELIPEARAAMAGWLAENARDGHPSYTYSVEQFGLTEAEIRETFAEYMRRFVDPHEGVRSRSE